MKKQNNKDNKGRQSRFSIVVGKQVCPACGMGRIVNGKCNSCGATWHGKRRKLCCK